MTDQTTNLDLTRLRETASKVFVGLLWLHVPLVLVIAFARGSDWLLPLMLTMLLAGAATVSWRIDAAGPMTRYVVAVAFVGMVSTLVLQNTGRWQIDLHMYYFAVFAIIAAYCDWRAILLAAAVTAVQDRKSVV